MKLKVSAAVIGPLLISSLYWYFFISLKEMPITQSEFTSRYDYTKNSNVNIELSQLEPNIYTFTYQSFDGAIVNGQISFPEKQAEAYPVLIGVPAMGRGYQRWWVDSFKGRPTVTQVNKITEMASKKGYAVISIDSRYHGKRKDPKNTLRSIMNKLHFFGDKLLYEQMIEYTVMDIRVLLDWVENEKQFINSDINVAGYSMGGQISLLLGAVDQRVNKIISIVPPFIDDKIASVAPKNAAPLITKNAVLLVTSNDDENATERENEHLFSLIASAEKEHLVFPGSHILPDGYVNEISFWFDR